MTVAVLGVWAMTTIGADATPSKTAVVSLPADELAKAIQNIQDARKAIPADQNDITAYPIAQLKDAPNASAAAAFISYVLGPDVQRVLASFGFLPPG